MVSPIAPKLLRGAIVTIQRGSKVGAVITFQYNPESITRSLLAEYIGGEEQDRVDAIRFEGAPVETFSLTVFIDATDQLGVANSDALKMGIYPQLSALELLVYPSSSLIAKESQKLAKGTLEIIPPIAPLTLFVWGTRRTVPVRIDGFNVSEEAYDVNLNPIRARVGLTLRVLSYSDMSPNDAGYPIFMNYQKLKQQMAVNATSGTLKAVLQGDQEATLSYLQGL